jgi:hypothetical protein
MTTEATKTTTAPAPAPNEAELAELGFVTAAATVKTKRELARKLRIAFEHFRLVTPENFKRFNEELRVKTTKKDDLNWSTTFDQLMLTRAEAYGQVPPREVLDKVRQAKELGCFDRFEVATIHSVKVVPDPIIFGVIEGSDNRYFVAQWDDDVKIEDILLPHEG